jgi:hypothetical protein
MALFSARVIGIPLYPFQVDWCNYILGCIAHKRSEMITITQPRQSGKNEGSAQLEVAILARWARKGGGMVKVAPTFKPQIQNSRERVGQRATAAMQSHPWLKFRSSEGYKMRCGKAVLQLLSGQPEASVVGATASLLMEVDEAQDIIVEKFNKDFRPMTASTAAPMVFYGTPWTDETLLEQTNAEIESGQVQGRIFKIMPDMVVAANPAYGIHLEREVRRLGRDHPLIRTQYFLETLSAKGRMLNLQQLQGMIGDHARQEKRGQGGLDQRWIVAGLDFAGSDEEESGPVSLMTRSGRDSVALTIGAMEMLRLLPGLEVPKIRILARYEWLNVRPDTLHTALYRLLNDIWRVDLCVADATGVGETNTTLLSVGLNKLTRRMVGVKFDSTWKLQSELVFDYISAVNGGRLIDYRPTDAMGQAFDPFDVAKAERVQAGWEADRVGWWQRSHAKLRTREGKRAKAEVPENEGHDDLLISEMLCLRAAVILSGAAPQSSLA